VLISAREPASFHLRNGKLVAACAPGALCRQLRLRPTPRRSFPGTVSIASSNNHLSHTLARRRSPGDGPLVW
jgi:hypothetical protein